MARAGLTRQRVVQAAADIIAQEGLEALTLRKVAQALGVKTPSLFNHIKNSQDLILALKVEAFTRLRLVLLEASATLSGAEAFYALCHAYRGFAKEEEGYFMASLRHVEDEDEALKTAAYALMGLLERLYQSLGLHKQADIIHAIRALRAAITGFCLLEKQEAFAREEDLEESFKRLVAMLVLGVQAKPAS